MQNIRGKMASGVVWMLLFKLIDRSIGLVSTVILARLLAPESFGVVAMATSFIAMLELIGAFGFDMALIQRPDATRKDYDTAWTLAAIFGCGLALLMLLLAIPISRFYRHPELVAVICALAFGSLVGGFQNVGVVAFRRDLEFNKEFRFLLAKRLITFPLTIALAFILQSYWALVVGMTSGRIIDVWLSYRLHPYRPKFSLAAGKELMGFSKWLLVLNLLTFLRVRSSDFVIGRMGGADSLGLFSVSYELANMPGTELVAPINRAVYPAYARLAADPEAMRREYLSVMGMICLVAIPAVAGMAATANIVVPLLLGPKWLSAIPILQILSFAGISLVMQSNAYSLFLALGRGDVFAKINGANVLLLIAALLLLVPTYGVIGGAYAYLTAALFMLPIGIGSILLTLKLSVWSFVREIWRPMLATALMFAAVASYTGRIQPGGSTMALIGDLLTAVSLGAFTDGVLVFVFWWIVGFPAAAETVIWNRLVKVISSARQNFR